MGDKQLGNHPITTDLPSRKSNISHLGKFGKSSSKWTNIRGYVSSQEGNHPPPFFQTSRAFGECSEPSVVWQVWKLLVPLIFGQFSTWDHLMIWWLDQPIPRLGLFFFGGDILISNFFFGGEVLSNILRCCFFLFFWWSIHIYLKNIYIKITDWMKGCISSDI